MSHFATFCNWMLSSYSIVLPHCLAASYSLLTGTQLYIITMGWFDGWRREKKKDASSLVESLEQSVTLTPKAQSELRQVQELFNNNPTALSCLSGAVCFVAGWKAGSWSRAATSWTRRLTSVADVASSNIGSTAPWLRGQVVSVSDGDTVRFLHAPTWFHSSSLQKGEKMSDVALPVRVCTIDTPETAKLGKPGQPFGEEAKKCLSDLTLDKIFHIQLLQKDQYGRAVAAVKAPGMLPGMKRYADEHLLKQGLAEVYRGSGAVYGRLGKDAYIEMEQAAKKSKKGMWAQGEHKRESAAEYKARLKKESS
jgi:endonuclease YncB( thermonuclease family)